MKLTFGFSPCPNDTFMFHGIASGIMQLENCDFSIQLHDVETLNQMAMKSHLDITKISFYAWLNVKNNYQLLNSGSALGHGCGPVLISKQNVKHDEIPRLRIVLPGKWTTAHLLFRLWAPEAVNKIFVDYGQIFDCLMSDVADLGVIIHESRFTFEKAGFKTVVDLGAWWENETKMPIPLGCIVVKNTVPDEIKKRLDVLIKNSIKYAMTNPNKSLPYIKKHAQETGDAILQKHIKTFVNDFSLDLGDKGNAAVKKLEDMARLAGVIC